MRSNGTTLSSIGSSADTQKRSVHYFFCAQTKGFRLRWVLRLIRLSTTHKTTLNSDNFHVFHMILSGPIEILSGLLEILSGLIEIFERFPLIRSHIRWPIEILSGPIEILSDFP